MLARPSLGGQFGAHSPSLEGPGPKREHDVRHSIAIGLLAAALLAAACGRTEQPAPAAPAAGADNPPKDAAWAVRIDPLQLPATGQAAEPNLTVSARGVMLSWLEHRDTTATLKFAERADGNWSPPRTVASSDKWFISGADVPTVMRLSDGTIVATAYPATDPSIEAYDLRLSYSGDDGKTWSRALAPHHDATKTQHGFATLLELPNRALGVVWLDGRDQELNKTDPDGGAMGLYFASFDRNWKQTAEEMADARVCECCQTTAAVTDDGPVVAFRDRSPREIRDISVTRLEQGKWTQARPLHVDGWQLDACPVNGPALSARGRLVAAAWFAATADEGHAYAAFSTDAGRTWGEPVRVDDAVSLGHVDVELLDDGSAVASWVEFANKRAQLRIRRVKSSGERSIPIVIAGTGEGYVSGYPRLARHGGEIVVAWSETTADGVRSQQVKAAVARMQ
jgi:hypothetical protein